MKTAHMSGMWKYVAMMAMFQFGFAGIASAQSCPTPVPIDSRCSVFENHPNDPLDCDHYRQDAQGHTIWATGGEDVKAGRDSRNDAAKAWECSANPEHLLLCPGAKSWIPVPYDPSDLHGEHKEFIRQHCPPVVTRSSQASASGQPRVATPSGSTPASQQSEKSGAFEAVAGQTSDHDMTNCVVWDHKSNNLADFITNRCSVKIIVGWKDFGDCKTGCADPVGPGNKSSVTKTKGTVIYGACVYPKGPSFVKNSSKFFCR